jgi:hypothetical protein
VGFFGRPVFDQFNFQWQHVKSCLHQLSFMSVRFSLPWAFQHCLNLSICSKRIRSAHFNTASNTGTKNSPRPCRAANPSFRSSSRSIWHSHLRPHILAGRSSQNLRLNSKLAVFHWDLPIRLSRPPIPRDSYGCTYLHSRYCRSACPCIVQSPSEQTANFHIFGATGEIFPGVVEEKKRSPLIRLVVVDRRSLWQTLRLRLLGFHFLGRS